MYRHQYQGVPDVIKLEEKSSNLDNIIQEKPSYIEEWRFIAILTKMLYKEWYDLTQQLLMIQGSRETGVTDEEFQQAYKQIDRMKTLRFFHKRWEFN